MIIIKPYTVVDAALISSNIPETDYAAWLVGTTYALAQRVIVIGTNSHKVYESLQAGNIGHTPASSSTWWLDCGATNRWDMFDRSVQSQSSNTSIIDVVLKPAQRIDSVALLNISAYTVQIKMTDATDGLVYNQTTVLASYSGIDDWFSYFYEPVVRQSDFIVNDLPPYTSATIEVILTDTGSAVLCGGLLVGQQEFIGNTQYGSSVGIQDYSLKTQDAFGNYSILQRAFRKTGSFQIQLASNYTDQLVSLLTSLRATPIIYSGSSDFTSMMIYGFYKDLAVNIAYPNVSTCTLTIEGLT
jgi:hypothetical protein